MYIHPTHMYYTYIHMAWLSCICIRICMYDMTCMFPWLICTYDSCAYAILPLMCMRDSFVCDIIKWHDSFVNVTWLICICDINKWHDSFVHVTWLICTCDRTHLYMWHHQAAWLIWTCDMTDFYMWQDSFVYVTRLRVHIQMSHVTHMNESFYICDTTHLYLQIHLYLWHDSFVYVTCKNRWVMSPKWMSHFARINVCIGASHS